MGENERIKDFKKAVLEILTSDEFDKLVKYEKFTARRSLKKLKEQLKDVNTVEKMPHWIPLLSAIKSEHALKDIIVFMMFKGGDK